MPPEINVTEIEPPVTQSAPTIVNVDATPTPEPLPVPPAPAPMPDYSAEFAAIRADNQRLADKLAARDDVDDIDDDDLTDQGETVVVAAAVATKTETGTAKPEGKAEAPGEQQPDDDRHAGGFW